MAEVLSTRIWGVPWLVGRYCSYLLPKQAGGTPQILVDKTSPMTGRLRVYLIKTSTINLIQLRHSLTTFMATLRPVQD